MSKVNDDDLDEKPLDPEMEKVRRKMVRLLAVSIGVMFIGLMAVLGAIVYKFTQADDTAVAGSPVAGSSMVVPSDAPIASVASLPEGFVVESVSLDGPRIGFFGRSADGSRRLIIHDMTTGRIVGDVVVINR
ncbi:MAG: membrane protein [Hoeflea sp. BRH_c9]|nr:MAG: membrane protein [Hoeflea sp. BRH_c9]